MVEEVISCFREEQVVYLATVDDLQPRVRPMNLIKTDDGFYMITGARGGVNAKKLVQIRKNPRIEYYLTLEGDQGDGFIRGEGIAIEIVDKDTKSKIYNLIGWAKNFFDTLEHPDYMLIKIEHTGFSFRKPGNFDIHFIPVEQFNF